MRLAIAHDWLTNLGGGERVVEALHESFSDAPIYTSVYNQNNLPILNNAQIVTSFLQHWPFSKTRHQLYPTLRAMAFESFDFSNYDIVISSSSAEAKGIITTTETLHMAYIHTPTRYYWSGYDDYVKHPGFGSLDPVVRQALPRVVKKMRKWDYAAAQRPDVMIANSRTVADRITKYYNRSSTVIYPPVDIKRFTNKSPRDDGYYLVVSRLIPYKRVDLAIEACNVLKKPLKIVGTGSQLSKLQAIAGPMVEFIDSADDNEVTKLYLNAKAFLFTAFEDFGITPVEAMAAGKPVIAYGFGGSAESVIDSKTGVLFNNQSVDSVVEAIRRFESMGFSKDSIQARAKEFSKDRFIRQMQQLIEKHLSVAHEKT